MAGGTASCQTIKEAIAVRTTLKDGSRLTIDSLNQIASMAGDPGRPRSLFGGPSLWDILLSSQYYFRLVDKRIAR